MANVKISELEESTDVFGDTDYFVISAKNEDGTFTSKKLTGKGVNSLFEIVTDIQKKIDDLEVLLEEFTVTFVDYDDTVLDTLTVKYGYPAVTSVVPIRDGYQFIGWDKNVSAIKEDLTVKAQYTQMVVEDKTWRVTTTAYLPGESSKFAYGDYLAKYVYQDLTQSLYVNDKLVKNGGISITYDIKAPTKVTAYAVATCKKVLKLFNGIGWQTWSSSTYSLSPTVTITQV